jgi:hypothetical protein
MPTATTTVAIDEFDPLQCCADAAMAALVHDRWLARRLPLLVKAAGFDVRRFDGHAYVQTIEPQYLLTLVDRGTDALHAAGSIGVELGQALQNDAPKSVSSAAGSLLRHRALLPGVGESKRIQSILYIGASPLGVIWKTRSLSGSEAFRFRACIGVPIGSLYSSPALKVRRSLPCSSIVKDPSRT